MVQALGQRYPWDHLSEGTRGLAATTARMLGGDPPGVGRRVVGLVLAHPEDCIRDFEVVAATAHDEEGRHALALIELTHPIEQRRDGLALLVDQGIEASARFVDGQVLFAAGRPSAGALAVAQ